MFGTLGYFGSKHFILNEDGSNYSSSSNTYPFILVFSHFFFKNIHGFFSIHQSFKKFNFFPNYVKIIILNYTLEIMFYVFLLLNYYF